MESEAASESRGLYTSETEPEHSIREESNDADDNENDDDEDDMNEEALLGDDKENFSNGTLVVPETAGEEGQDNRTFCERLHNDISYRRNYLLTLNLIAAFFALGWMAGQAGPSFLDLQLITNVSLDRGSAFFTAGGVGYLSGSLVTGYVFDKIKDKVFIVFISLVGMGVTTAAIPFCYIYELMVFVQLVRGITAGGLDTSGNTLLSRTWGKQGRMFMQALHFGFAFGGSLSPLAIAPFLSERNSVDVSDGKGNSNTSVSNVSSTLYNVTNGSYGSNSTVFGDASIRALPVVASSCMCSPEESDLHSDSTGGWGPVFSKEVWTVPVMESRRHSQSECKSKDKH
ncbi:hypothetical protein FSP39_024591 [Pinctada imbricata]|uniref:Uncharacterized protein n=1 Tax=Pinctada imbricata TaxID=66713 RepID=A0AA88YVX9_PINIB|nr:hypothetical protein FSP39_024591 [Pinctada imbricata]